MAAFLRKHGCIRKFIVETQSSKLLIRIEPPNVGDGVNSKDLHLICSDDLTFRLPSSSDFGPGDGYETLFGCICEHLHKVGLSGYEPIGLRKRFDDYMEVTAGNTDNLPKEKTGPPIQKNVYFVDIDMIFRTGSELKGNDLDRLVTAFSAPGRNGRVVVISQRPLEDLISAFRLVQELDFLGERGQRSMLRGIKSGLIGRTATGQSVTTSMESPTQLKMAVEYAVGYFKADDANVSFTGPMKDNADAIGYVNGLTHGAAWVVTDQGDTSGAAHSFRILKGVDEQIRHYEALFPWPT